jgi:hypothetical protein
MVPFGLLKLSTNPYWTGSTSNAKTIGIVDVAVLAAYTEMGEPTATITAVPRLTTNSEDDRDCCGCCLGCKYPNQAAAQHSDNAHVAVHKLGHKFR